MMSKYQSARSKRFEAVTKTGRFRGGRLAPVMAVPVRPSESGMLSQSLTMELDPIAGRLLTQITGELISVFVPVQACDAILDPASNYAGLTDVIREKLLTGTPLFGLENEGELTQRMGVEPRSIGGAKRVCSIVRLAHNCAVNFLRQRLYDKAAVLPHTNTAVTPALLSSTILQRMNGVLDPDDRINGAVQLELPSLQLPVLGLGTNTAVAPAAINSVRESDGTTDNYAEAWQTGTSPLVTKAKTIGGVKYPDVVAQLNGVAAGNVSLVDFYNAETMDKLIREMDQIIKDNPEYGQEMVLRWAHGLSVDTGKTPFVISEQRKVFGRSMVGATDTSGVNNDVLRSDYVLEMDFSVPIPKTELGGIIVTFATVKPDETLASQPHPILTEPWGVDNFVADELALDPVAVTGRDLDSGIASGSEGTVMFYMGHNHLKKSYMHYGFTRNLNQTTVAAKTAIWQLQIPMSVTPSSILYPADISHYPFADQLAEVCTYSISSTAAIETPMQFGPTPVENIAVVGTADLFDLVP